jgi:hypothetical protein
LVGFLWHTCQSPSWRTAWPTLTRPKISTAYPRNLKSRAQDSLTCAVKIPYSIQRYLRRCAIACHCRGSWRTTPNERTTGAKRPSRVSQRQQTHSRCTATQAQSCRDRCAIRREARDSRLIGCGDPVQERLCPYSVKVEVKLATFDLAAANPIGSPMLTSTDHQSAAATCVPLPTR